MSVGETLGWLSVDAWVTNLETSTFTRLPHSDLPVGRHFASSGHTTEDMLVGFQDATDSRSFEARDIQFSATAPYTLVVALCT